MLQIIFGIIVGIFTFAIRCYFSSKVKGFGNDFYWYLKISENMKKKHRLTTRLSNKWSIHSTGTEPLGPMGWPLILSLLPQSIIKKYYWAISPMVEGIHSFITFNIIFIFTNNLYFSLIGTLFYLVSYSATLDSLNPTPRSFGIMLQTISLFFLVEVILNKSIILIIIFVFCSAFTYIFHRFEFQNIIFVSIILFLLYAPYLVFISFIPIIVSFIILPWPTWYTVKSHIQQIIYWSHHWKNIGLEILYESPFYENIRPDKFISPSLALNNNRSGIKGLYLQSKVFILKNSGIILSFYGLIFFKNNLVLFLFCLWCFIIFSFHLITNVVPVLRGLASINYGKQIASSIAIIAGILTNNIKDEKYLVIFLIFQAILFVYGITKQTNIIKNRYGDKDFDNVISYFKKKNKRVLVFPFIYGDRFIYETGCESFAEPRTLEGFKFNDFTKYGYPFYPNLQKKIEDIIKEYVVDYLIMKSDYVKIEDLNLNYKMEIEFGEFKIYSTVVK